MAILVHLSFDTYNNLTQCNHETNAVRWLVCSYYKCTQKYRSCSQAKVYTSRRIMRLKRDLSVRPLACPCASASLQFYHSWYPLCGCNFRGPLGLNSSPVSISPHLVDNATHKTTHHIDKIIIFFRRKWYSLMLRHASSRKDSLRP